MTPGQLTPNEFELAILQRIGAGHPALLPFIPKLHVMSRKYTGVGSFTDFLVERDSPPSHPDLGDQALGLDAELILPGVPNGMGAVLFCTAGCPNCLETYTYGADKWDGTFEGFSLSSPR